MVLKREHIFVKDAEFIPDGGFAVSLWGAEEQFSFVKKKTEWLISWEIRVCSAHACSRAILHGQIHSRFKACKADLPSETKPLRSKAREVEGRKKGVEGGENEREEREAHQNTLLAWLYPVLPC